MRVRPAVIVAGGLIAVAALSGCASGSDHAAADHSDTGHSGSMAPGTSGTAGTAAAPVGVAGDIAFAQLTAWLAEWGAPVEMTGSSGHPAAMDHGGHDMGGMAMSGMMTAEQLADLAQAEGDTFDRAWLTMMIAHHAGAIEMATQVKATTGNPDVAALADAIIAAQAEEIDTMRDLLAG